MHRAGTLRIVDARGGGVLRTLRVSSGSRLGGPGAWSPDGSLLAVSAPAGVTVVDPTGAGGPAPPPLDVGEHPVLGWAAADRIVLLVPEPAGGAVDPDRQWITEVPLDGGEARRLASVPRAAATTPSAASSSPSGSCPTPRWAGPVRWTAGRGRWSCAWSPPWRSPPSSPACSAPSSRG